MDSLGEKLAAIRGGIKSQQSIKPYKNTVYKSYYDSLEDTLEDCCKQITRIYLEPQAGDSITLIPMADLHWGHQRCDNDKVKRHLEFIYEHDDCYTIFLGDELETATKMSVGMSIYEESEHLPQQVDTMYRLLKPLAKENKILGMIPGNHSMRVANLIGMNLTEELAKGLRVPYMGYQGYMSLNVAQQNYSIVAFHGSGGGGMNGSKVNSAEKISKVAIADCYLLGHTHIRHHTEDLIYEFMDGKLVPRVRHYVTCGAFLDYFGGYAEMKGLSPSPNGSVCIEFMADFKDIRVHI